MKTSLVKWSLSIQQYLNLKNRAFITWGEISGASGLKVTGNISFPILGLFKRA